MYIKNFVKFLHFLLQLNYSYHFIALQMIGYNTQMTMIQKWLNHQEQGQCMISAVSINFMQGKDFSSVKIGVYTNCRCKDVFQNG